MSRDHRRVLYVATPEERAARRKPEKPKPAKALKIRKVTASQKLRAPSQKTQVRVHRLPVSKILQAKRKSPPRRLLPEKLSNNVPRGSLADIITAMDYRARLQEGQSE